jgi:hypothetical protein
MDEKELIEKGYVKIDEHDCLYLNRERKLYRIGSYSCFTNQKCQKIKRFIPGGYLQIKADASGRLCFHNSKHKTTNYIDKLMLKYFELPLKDTPRITPTISKKNSNKKQAQLTWEERRKAISKKFATNSHIDLSKGKSFADYLC